MQGLRDRGVFRDQEVVDLDLDPREEAALGELGTRRSALLGRAVGLGTAAGMLAGVAIGWLLHVLADGGLARGEPHMWGLVLTGSTVLGAYGGRLWGRRRAAAKARGWVEEAAKRHKVDPERVGAILEQASRL
jgi:hypothetical protein